MHGNSCNDWLRTGLSSLSADQESSTNARTRDPQIEQVHEHGPRHYSPTTDACYGVALLNTCLAIIAMCDTPTIFRLERLRKANRHSSLRSILVSPDQIAGSEVGGFVGPDGEEMRDSERRNPWKTLVEHGFSSRLQRLRASRCRQRPFHKYYASSVTPTKLQSTVNHLRLRARLVWGGLTCFSRRFCNSGYARPACSQID